MPTIRTMMGSKYLKNEDVTSPLRVFHDARREELITMWQFLANAIHRASGSETVTIYSCAEWFERHSIAMTFDKASARRIHDMVDVFFPPC